MSNIIFSAGFIIDYPSLNIEMMRHYSKMWNLEHTLMGKGHFGGSMFAIHTPRIQLSLAHYSKSLVTQGDFPNGCVVLTYSANEAAYTFQNRLMAPYEIIMLSKGDEIDVVTSGVFDAHTIVIEEELFYKELYDFFGEIPQSCLQNKRLIIQSSMISQFHNTVNLWKNYLANELPKLTSAPDYRKIESTILRELFNCLLFTSSVKRRKKFQAKAVRELLHEKVADDIDISKLTRELNISESQLHHAFKKDYGITPKKYLQNLRLNAVRKELLLADAKVATINNIAQKYNFYHMGHFSAEYKKLFSQTPSQTLIQKI